MPSKISLFDKFFAENSKGDDRIPRAFNLSETGTSGLRMDFIKRIIQEDFKSQRLLYSMNSGEYLIDCSQEFSSEAGIILFVPRARLHGQPTQLVLACPQDFIYGFLK